MIALEVVLLVVVCAFDAFLGALVLVRNHRSWSNRLLALTSASLVVWLILNFACDQPRFYHDALLLNRLAMAQGLLMGASLFALAITFPSQRLRVSWWWRIGLAGICGFAILSLFTDTVIQDVTLESWGTNVIQGRLFPYLAAWGVAVAAALVGTLVRHYRTASTRQRGQMKYLFIGLVSFTGVELLIGSVLPFITGTNEFMRLNPLVTLTFLLPTSYAIVRHRLMNVSFMAMRGVAYAVLATAFGGIFLVLANMGRNHLVSHLGLSPDVALFIGGVVCVLSFQPVLSVLRRATDRFLYRHGYEPARLLEQLSKLISSTLEPVALATLLASTLSREMRVAAVSVIWLREGLPRSEGTAEPLAEAELHALLRLCDGDSVLVADEQEEEATARTLEETGVRVLVPLHAEGTLLGALVLGPRSSGEMYSVQDIEFLRILASETAIAVKNAQLYDEKAQRIRELTALNRLSVAIGADIGLDAVLERALTEIVAATKADSGSIMLIDDAEQVLRIARAEGLPKDAVENTCVPLGEGIAGWVAATREALILVDDTDPRFKRDLVRHDIVSAICTPVVARDRVIGVLNLNRIVSPELFTSEALHVATSFAGQLGVAIENARLYSDLESTFLGTISALAAAVDAKDPYTFGHSNEVTEKACALAERLGLPDEEIHTIRIAATLHDIGKIGIDGDILNKPGKLTAEERAIINRHPAIGADILAPLSFLREAIPYILFHHEQFGGAGYPSGISGQAIPLGARIISVADSFNAMVSDRPYRRGMSTEEAIGELRSHAGSQFDPALVDIFIALLSEAAGAAAPARDGTAVLESPVVVATGADSARTR